MRPPRYHLYDQSRAELGPALAFLTVIEGFCEALAYAADQQALGFAGDIALVNEHDETVTTVNASNVRAHRPLPERKVTRAHFRETGMMRKGATPNR